MTYAYVRHIPLAPLSSHIDWFYFYDGPMAFLRTKMLPSPSPHLLVNFGGAFKVYDGCRGKLVATCTESWWAGLWSTYHIVDWPINTRVLGVQFKPGGAFPFLQLPLSDLHNQFVPADAIWGHSAAEIRERLFAAPNTQAQFILLEQLLLDRLGETPRGLKMVQHALGEIARQHGAVSIGALSDRIGISQNRLLIQFKRMVGVSPKELARLYRLKYALRSIVATQPVDWALIAHQSGYYDQAHFNKDVAAFLGHTPTEYLRLRRQLLAANPERARLLRILPVD